MTPVGRWLRRQALREQRAVYLEDALLTGRFGPYAAYRLRYFVLRYLTESLLHGVRFVVLWVAFEDRLFVAVVVVNAVASLISSFWWGSLEVMRARVRRLFQSDRARGIPEEIGGWLVLAGLASGTVVAASFVGLAVAVGAGGQGVGVFECYVAAVGLRLGLDLGARTLHSGVYAIRRVYRPLPALVAVEVVAVLAIVVAWPWMGAWSLPVATLLGAAVSTGLTVRYTVRLYRFFLWWPLELSGWRALRRLRGAPLRELVTAGASYALMKLDAFLVLALFWADGERGRPGELFVFFYLLSPTVQAGFDWAQLFYFDLKRLETARFVNLRARYDRFLARLALGLGVGFWAAACGLATVIQQSGLGVGCALLGPFFVSRSLLALAQIQAFSSRRYSRLLASGACLLVGIVGLGFLGGDGWTKLGGLSAVTAVVLALLWVSRGRPVGDPEPRRVLSPVEWIRTLQRVREPARVRVAQLAWRSGRGRGGLHPSAGAEAAWRQRRAAERIARRLASRGAVTTIGPDRVAWYERGNGNGAAGESWVFVAGGGLWESVASAGTCDDGPSALSAARRANLFGEWMPSDATCAGRLSAGGWRQHFLKLCPGGLVYAPDEPVAAGFGRLSSREKRAVFLDAVYFAERLWPRPSRGPFEVTALWTEDALRLIFLSPRGVDSRRRARWVRQIREANILVALTSLDGPDAQASVTVARVRS